jgi:hypothetical protein
MPQLDKKAGLAGSGISTCEEVAKILPKDHGPILPSIDRMKALSEIKRYIEDGMAKERNLQLVQVPLIVEKTGIRTRCARPTTTIESRRPRRSSSRSPVSWTSWISRTTRQSLTTRSLSRSGEASVR